MTNTLVAQNANTLPDYLKTDVALGNENLTSETLAVPYISLLQNLSKPCVKGSAEYVKGAEAGQFFNTVSKSLTEEIICCNMFVDVVFAVNKKRDLGDDYQGEFVNTEDAMSHLEAEKLNPNDYDVKEVHKHTLAIFDSKTGELDSAAVFSMRNTALKSSRTWNTQIVSAYPNADRFSGIWKLTPKMNSNAKGSWYTPDVELMGYPSEETHAMLTEKFALWR